ncbi:MAG TPA: hypothetical protein VGZ22_22490 [Isosphaeraceae bacterium]|nr:hypothetical protein [Isosphaeraceae bacterium]
MGNLMTAAAALETSTEHRPPGLPYMKEFLNLAVEVRALADDFADLTAQMGWEHRIYVPTIRVLGALVAGCESRASVWAKLRVRPASVIVSLLELQARGLVALDGAGEPVLLDAGQEFYADLYLTNDDRLSDELYHEWFDDRIVLTKFVKLCRQVTRETSAYFALPVDERAETVMDVAGAA